MASRPHLARIFGPGSQRFSRQWLPKHATDTMSARQSDLGQPDTNSCPECGSGRIWCPDWCPDCVQTVRFVSRQTRCGHAISIRTGTRVRLDTNSDQGSSESQRDSGTSKGGSADTPWGVRTAFGGQLSWATQVSTLPSPAHPTPYPHPVRTTRTPPCDHRVWPTHSTGTRGHTD